MTDFLRTLIDGDSAIKALFLMMMVDITGGIAKAIKLKSLNSTTSFSGMTKKAGVILVVCVVGILQPHLHLPVMAIGGASLTAMDGVALLYVVTEAISVLEKAAVLGVWVPPFLLEALSKIRGEDRTPLLGIVTVDSKPCD